MTLPPVTVLESLGLGEFIILTPGWGQRLSSHSRLPRPLGVRLAMDTPPNESAMPSNVVISTELDGGLGASCSLGTPCPILTVGCTAMCHSSCATCTTTALTPVESDSAVVSRFSSCVLKSGPHGSVAPRASDAPPHPTARSAVGAAQEDVHYAARVIQAKLRGLMARRLVDVMRTVQRSRISLGEGTFGVVWQSTIIGADGARLAAIKVVPYDRGHTDRARVLREAAAMRKASGYENILSLYGVHFGLHSAYLVFELCDGGDLFTHAIMGNKVLPETEALRIFRDVLRAVEVLHYHGVVHNDVKLENVLLKKGEGTDTYTVKLGDFGHAILLPRNEQNEIVGWWEGIGGTPNYAAPEAVAWSNTGTPYIATAAEAWTLGVLLYAMLTRAYPFKEASLACPTFAQYLQDFQKSGCAMAEIHFPRAHMAPISAFSRCIINCLLHVDPLERMDVSTALEAVEQVVPAYDGAPVAPIYSPADVMGLEKAANVPKNYSSKADLQTPVELSASPVTVKLVSSAGLVVAGQASTPTVVGSKSSSSAANSPISKLQAASGSPKPPVLPSVSAICLSAGSAAADWPRSCEPAFLLCEHTTSCTSCADDFFARLPPPKDDADTPFPYCNMF